MADFKKLKSIRNKEPALDRTFGANWKKQFNADHRDSDDEATQEVRSKYGVLYSGDDLVKDWRNRYENKMSNKRNEIPKFHGQLDETVDGESADDKAKKRALKKMQDGK